MQLLVDDQILKRALADPDGHVAPGAAKVAPAVFADHDRLRTVAEYVPEALARKAGANVHVQGPAIFTVGHDHRKTGIIVFLVAPACPPDQMFTFKAVALLAVGVVAAQLDELAEIWYQRAILDRIAVVVRVEHARHTLLPQQDQSIRGSDQTGCRGYPQR